MPKTAPRRRPGYPRKQAVPNRITLRLDETLYAKMGKVCEDRDITQREFVEDALLAELNDPQPQPAPGTPASKLSRTGMWIDPKLVIRMDKLIEKEGSTQRAVIERAVRRSLQP